MRRTGLDVHGRLLLKLQQQENDTWIGVIENPRLSDKDDIGALYYVIAVIFIYGLSIVMMIASHIRKNKQDCQLRAYLKEMAILRKADRREKVMERITALAAASKPKSVSKNDGSGPGKGLFRLSSKASFKLGSKRNSLKEPPGSDVGVSGGGGGGGAGKEGGEKISEATEDPCQSLVMKTDTRLNEELLQPDDGNETADSEYLELPVDFALDMNRLTPSANATPLTSASATPSPPPRHEVKPGMTKINFSDDEYVL